MPPVLTLIAAVSDDGFISRGQGVPWHLPADIAHFRAYAAGKWLLIGRRTYHELQGWFRDHTPLVLSRSEDFVPTIGIRVGSVDEALQRTKAAELVVCGGAATYALAMPLADRLVLTHVHTDLGNGLPFPSFDRKEWRAMNRQSHPADAKHEFSCEIVAWERVPGA